jgi:hypothetical protein
MSCHGLERHINDMEWKCMEMQWKWNGMERNGNDMEWNFLERNGNGMEIPWQWSDNGMEFHVMERQGIPCHGMERNDMEM